MVNLIYAEDGEIMLPSCPLLLDEWVGGHAWENEQLRQEQLGKGRGRDGVLWT